MHDCIGMATLSQSAMPRLPLEFRPRFQEFVRSIPGAECIDDLPQTHEQRVAKKADFFFENRRIVCELKNLETDTSPKLEKLIKPLQDRPEWPVFYGKRPLRQVLQKFPEAEEIQRRAFEATTTAINKHVADANRQIRTTKQTFGVPDAGGMLVLANEAIAILSPDVIAHKVHRMLNKRLPDGRPQFPEINMVWMISEKHVTEFRPDMTGISCLLLRNAVPDPTDVETFVESLQHRWAEFHRVPCHVISGANVDELKFRKNPNLEKSPPRNPTRAESWAREYEARPYLQGLSDPRLIKHATRVFAGVTAGLMKQATGAQRARAQTLMRTWTHVLEEINRRGMDIRDLSVGIRPLGNRLRRRQSFDRQMRLGRNDPCPCTSGKKYKDCHGRPSDDG